MTNTPRTDAYAQFQAAIDRVNAATPTTDVMKIATDFVVSSLVEIAVDHTKASDIADRFAAIIEGITEQDEADIIGDAFNAILKSDLSPQDKVEKFERFLTQEEKENRQYTAEEVAAIRKAAEGLDISLKISGGHFQGKVSRKMTDQEATRQGNVFSERLRVSFEELGPDENSLEYMQDTDEDDFDPDNITKEEVAANGFPPFPEQDFQMDIKIKGIVALPGFATNETGQVFVQFAPLGSFFIDEEIKNGDFVMLTQDLWDASTDFGFGVITNVVTGPAMEILANMVSHHYLACGKPPSKEIFESILEITGIRSHSKNYEPNGIAPIDALCIVRVA